MIERPLSLAVSRAELSSHDRILLAARELFSTEGFENTTTSAIARHAGTSESQLIKHFGSKEGLLEAIFADSWERIGFEVEMAVAQAETPIAQFEALCEAMLRAMESDVELRVLFLLEGRRIRRHGHQILLTGGFLRLIEAIDRLLQAMAEHGELRPGLHLQAVRSALFGCLEGMLRDQLVAERVPYPATFSKEELRASFRAALSGFLAR